MDSKESRLTNKFLQKTLKPRNPNWDAEIMRKGGSHQVPKRAKHAKRQMEVELAAA